MKKVSFPRMGWSHIAFKALYTPIPGIEVFEPPAVNREIIKLGAKYSPEFVCFPFKVTLGEMLYMIIHHEVTTFIMAIDCGPCRLGFYAPIQERIIKDLGYDVQVIPIQQADLWTLEFIEPFYQLTSVSGKLMQYVDFIKAFRLALTKGAYIEQILKYAGFIRCREKESGATTQVVKDLMQQLDRESRLSNLFSFDTKIKSQFRKIDIDREKKPLRILIAGENHVALEPYVNMDITEKFGNEGIEVHLGNSLFDWVLHKLHLNFERKRLEKLAKPYIPLDIGGEAVWVIGYYLDAQKKGFDGFIHVYPFTCMPEVTARGIIEGQSPKSFYLPVQFYSFDEHTGYEGMRTRLESFIDLMKSNQENNPQFQNHYKEPSELNEIYDVAPKYYAIDSFAKNILNPITEITMAYFKRNKTPKSKLM